MSKTVSNVGALSTVYALRDIRAERIGYLTLFSFGIEGFKYRFELLDRGKDAVFVLPVDWSRRVLYLVQQPRPIKAMSCAAGRKVLAAVAANPELSLSINVPGASIHTIDAPAGMIDGEETEEAAGIREVLEETGFVINADGLAKVAVHFTSTGDTTSRHICFLASVGEHTPREKPEGDGDERINTLELSFDEAFAMMDDFTCEHASLGKLLEHVRRLDDGRIHKARITELEQQLSQALFAARPLRT